MVTKPLNFIIMKTIADLFELILTETKLNEGKLVQYTFNVDTKYKCVSMYEDADIEGHEAKTILSHTYIKTPEQLQLVYWIIFNNGRSRYQG